MTTEQKIIRAKVGLLELAALILLIEFLAGLDKPSVLSRFALCATRAL